MDHSPALAEGTNRLARVLLAVTGCAQAEVVPRLVRNLLDHPDIGKHQVIVAATRPALEFFEVSQVRKLTGRRVFVNHTDGTGEFPVPHIGLVEWADVIIVYPASANTLAKCAHGICDSLVSTLVLAAPCPVYFGPAMNGLMLQNSITQRNLQILQDNGYRFVPQELGRVLIHSTGQIEERMYCTETMVLSVCEDLFHSTSTPPGDSVSALQEGHLR